MNYPFFWAHCWVITVATSAMAQTSSTISNREMSEINWMEFKEVVPSKINTVKFIIHPQIQLETQQGTAWAKAFLQNFDLSKIRWVRIDFGRENIDRRGRKRRKFHGVYGR